MDDSEHVMVGRRARRAGGWVLAGLLCLAIAVGGAYAAGRAVPPPVAGPRPSPSMDPETAERAVRDTAASFLDAWEAESWDDLQSLITDQSLNAAEVHRSTNERLRITDTTFAEHEPILDDDRASVRFDATWSFEDLPPYEYEGELQLAPDADSPTGWGIRWWYTAVHPDLSPQTRVERTRVFPQRAPILAANGRPLVTTTETVVVGVHPARVESRAAVRRALRQYTDTSDREVRRLLRSTDRDDNGFHPIAQLSPTRFEALRPQLFAVDGLVFRREQRRRDHGAQASALIGSLGAITAEQLEDLGEPYGVTDRVGQTGLERVFERRLAGRPALEAAITDDVGLVRSLSFRAGAPARPVRTTLDLAAQRSALRALRAAPAPAALVALDTTNGAVRAVAFTPVRGFNRALSGLYAPGSTFKVVTSFAALNTGLTPQSRLDCPGRIRVADRFISNDSGSAYGRVTLRQALAVSCNTTFARLGARAGPGGLVTAAEAFGFNANPDFTIPAATPQFPRPQSLAETTRAAIGQARVQASPLHMASVAATAASGVYRPPTLIAGSGAPATKRIGAPAARKITRMMRAVVTFGTARRVDFPGVVHGKTGTAQFGGGVRTHAWFIGFRKHLAFAVVVEGAGHGGAVAAPVAADFLRGLPDR